MSKSVHLQRFQSHKQAKNDVFTTGTSLVKLHAVNQRFTYKELTLIIGIIVALIIVVTLWMNQVQITEGATKSDAMTTPLTGMLRQSMSLFKLDLF
jgi:hypothetical protein